MTASLDVDLLDLARLDITAEGTVWGAEKTNIKPEAFEVSTIVYHEALEQCSIAGRDLHSIVSPGKY